MESLDDLHDLGLVLVRDGDQDFPAARGREARGDERLPERGRERAIDPHDLARAFHLGTEIGVDVEQLRHREDRSLQRDEVPGRPDPVGAGVALRRERRPERDGDRDLHQRHAGDLREEGDGPARARVHLEHPHPSVFDDELDVQEALHG